MTEAATTEAPANPDAGGLLDNASSTPAVEKNPDPNETTIAHLADDGVPDPVKVAEKRKRPDYVPEKFWDAENASLREEAAMKSYAEMEKNFKLGKHKPPEGGKYDLSFADGKVAPDDPVMGTYTEWAQKHGLSQAAFEELASKVVEQGAQLQQQSQLSRKAELQKLGPQAGAIIDSMTDWARGFVRSGVWTQEDWEEFKVMGGTAAGMRALMRLRESYEGHVPLKETLPQDVGMSDEELHARIGDPRYAKNEGGFRDETERMFAKRYGGTAA